jgi:lipopolysaccharide exporter
MTIPEPTPLSTTNLREQTTRAFKWSNMMALVNMLGQVFFGALLARLLTREEFGVVASGMVLFVLGNFVADMGMGAAIVQKPELTRGNIRAAFTSSLLLGGTMSVVGWFIAPLAGHYFKNPEVVTVFRGLALSYIILTTSIVSTNLLRRAMNFRALVIAELIAYLVGHGIFGLGSAALGYGAMSLVISTFAQNILLIIVTYAAARFPFALTFRWADFRDLYAFGTRSSVAGLADYVSQSIDILMIGHFYSTATLGLYNRAFSAVCNPMMSFSRSVSRVLESSMSAVQNDRARLRRAYVISMTTMSMLLFPVAFGIWVCGREIVLVLLGAKFTAAIPVVMALALYIPFPILANISSTVVTATARLNARIVIQAAYLVLLTLAFFVAHWLQQGLVGFAVALTVVSVLRCLAYAVVVGRITGGGDAESLRAYIKGILSGLVVAAPLYVVTVLMRQAHVPLPLLFATELLLGGGLLLAALLFGPQTEVQNQLRSRLNPLLARHNLRLGAKT